MTTNPHPSTSRVRRVLVDHSGYELANLGDTAMLVSGLDRMLRLWPDAEFMVITHAPQRLAVLYPGVRAVDPEPWLAGPLDGRPAVAVEQLSRLVWPFRRDGRGFPATGPVPLPVALSHADVVVSTGGGFVNSAWPRHSLGVLHLLGQAQRRGVPTAMFGQGLGPMTMRRSRIANAVVGATISHRARRVLPHLGALGLRETVNGPATASALGADYTVTGDDALEIAVTGTVSTGRRVGLNVRQSGYGGAINARGLGRGLTAAFERSDGIVAVPISTYDDGEDMRAIDAALREMGIDPVDDDVVMQTPSTPRDLSALVADCNLMVTLSYHAGVFALAQGVPVLGLAPGPYYRARYQGLAALFGDDACRVIDMSQRGWERHMAESARTAQEMSLARREEILAVAVDQRERGRALYRSFADSIAQRR